MVNRKSIVLAILVVLIPAWAGAWRALNRLEVHPVSKTAFEVVARVGSGPADFWCGAGDYVSHGLGKPVVTRIYIWKAIGPSKSRSDRKAVQFSLSPPKGASTSPGYSLSVKAVGDNMTAAAAYQYCLNNDDRYPFWPFSN